MNRRVFLKTTLQKTKERYQSSLPSLSPYTGTWDRQTVRHLVRRTMFGAKKADVDYFLTKTMSQAVDELLTVSAVPPPTLPDNYHTDTWQNNLKNEFFAGRDPYNWLKLNPKPPVNVLQNNWLWNYNYYNVPKGMPIIASRVEGERNGKRDEEGIWWGTINTIWSWWLELIRKQERNIREKMVIFWHQFFPTGANAVYCCTYTSCEYWQNALLRYRAMGNFKTLLREVSTTTPMLFHLNGNENTKYTPNQNYGRELQEVYALGKVVDMQNPNNSYTEQDVVEISRILTGWRCHPENGISVAARSYFVPNLHDTGDKKLSAYYGNVVIKGKTGAAGATELDELLNIMATKNDMSINVATKVYRFFVSSQIDNEIQTNIIEPLAQTLRNNNYEMKPVMSQLLKSQHFYDKAIRGNMVKSPIDYIYGLVREFSIIYPNKPEFIFWATNGEMGSWGLETLGQPLYHLTAFGWKAYYDGPYYDRHWLNGASLRRRKQLSDQYINNNWNAASPCMCSVPNDEWWELNNDIVAMAQNMSSTPFSPSSMADGVETHLMTIPLCTEAKTKLIEILETSAKNWQQTWTQYKNNPTNDSLKQEVTFRLRDFFISATNMKQGIPYNII